MNFIIDKFKLSLADLHGWSSWAFINASEMNQSLDAVANSCLAIAARCTSSGPSASRIVRAPAHSLARGKSSQTPPPPCTCIKARHFEGHATNNLQHGANMWAGSPSAFALQHVTCTSLRSLSSCNQPGTDVLPCHLTACFLRHTASCCLQCHTKPAPQHSPPVRPGQ